MGDNDEKAVAAAAPELDRKQVIKLLVELGPLVVFFLANSQLGIFWGTGAFMAATVVSLAVSWAVLGRIPTMPMVTAVFVFVFGGLTLWLQDDQFIKIKPTIVNGLFSAILAGGLLLDKIFLKVVFGDVMRLTEAGWRKLTVRWSLFFLVLAGLNEVVWRSFSTDFWVSFKVFGIMPLTMAFAIAQVGLLKRYEQS